MTQDSRQTHAATGRKTIDRVGYSLVNVILGALILRVGQTTFRHAGLLCQSCLLRRGWWSHSFAADHTPLIELSTGLPDWPDQLAFCLDSLPQSNPFAWNHLSTTR